LIGIMAGRGKILFGLLITAAVLLAIREPLMFSIDLGLVLRQDAHHPAEIKRLLRFPTATRRCGISRAGP
jgi:hypothetical protein